MQRRRNLLIWIGFAVAIVALVSYIPVFVPFPITRDVPWVNFLLFFAAIGLGAAGLRRAFRHPDVYRGKISGSILLAVSVLMLAFFSLFIFYFAKMVPASADALRVGQPAAGFTLTNADGKQVALSDLLKSHRGALLIFYRGYW